MTTKQIIPLFLHAAESMYTPGEYQFMVFMSDMSGSGYIPLSRIDFEFDIPTKEQIIARHTVLLREKIKEVHKEAERQATELRDQLSKLEALTYTAPETGEAAS